MKNPLIIVLLFLCYSANSQYLYNDIVGTRALNERMKTYTTQRVRTIMATGYDGSGAKTSDFNEWQEVIPSTRTLRVANRQSLSIVKQNYRFDEQNRLITILDTSGAITSTTTYSYDNNSNIISIKTVVKDSLNDFSQSETHSWLYQGNKPEKMWKILNEKDSTEYRFKSDEKGNTVSEQLFRRNVGLDEVNYYYDENNQLTDIVRYDKKLKMLLPDYMFEYDDTGRVIQKITTLSTASKNYIIWRYVFNDKGLKAKEALFNKQKELTGKIEYAYTFYP